MKVPGVVKIVQIAAHAGARASSSRWAASPSSRNNTWAAMKGREALKITWDDGPQQGPTTPRPTAPSSRRRARKPGKVVRNEGDVDKALASAAKRIDGRILHPRISPTRRWSRRPPPRASRTANAKSGPACRAPAGARDDVAEAAWHASPRTCHRPRHAARRRLRAQIQARLRGSRRRCSPKRWAARRSRWYGRARTTCSTATTTPSRPSASRPGSTPTTSPWLGGTAAPRPRSCPPSRPIRSIRVRHRARHGLGRHALRRAQPAHARTARRRATFASAGSGRSQHPARIRDPVLRGRNRPCSRARIPKTTCWS